MARSPAVAVTHFASTKNWTNNVLSEKRKEPSNIQLRLWSSLLFLSRNNREIFGKIMPFISSSYDGSSRRSSGSSTSGLRGLDRFSSTRKSSVYERPSTYNTATAATTNNSAASKYRSLERVGKNGEDSLPSRFSTISTSTPTSYKDSNSSTPFGISRRDSSTSSYLRYWSMRLEWTLKAYFSKGNDMEHLTFGKWSFSLLIECIQGFVICIYSFHLKAYSCIIK